MAEIKNFMRTQIDFRPSRGHINSDIIFTVLMSYNSSGRSETSASQIIIDAFSEYDPSEPEELTSIRDLFTKANSFIERYNVYEKKNIIDFLETHKETMDTTLLSPFTKTFSFSKEDETAMDMWEKINEIRFRDRGIIINKFMYQYLSRGKCPFYNSLSAARLFKWMKNEKLSSIGESNKRLEMIIDYILLFAKKGEGKYNFVEDFSNDEDKNERLKKLLGII